MNKEEWIRCPICENKTRVRLREDTELKKFPLFYSWGETPVESVRC